MWGKPMNEKSDALLPVPLSDGDLRDVKHHSDIVRVWVPINRPETIYTLAGQHAGDILEFWVEADTQYVSCRYTAPNGAYLAWYRSEPTPKGHTAAEAIGETINKKYRPLREAAP